MNSDFAPCVPICTVSNRINHQTKLFNFILQFAKHIIYSYNISLGEVYIILINQR
jgi:hypothetical protein